jgi:transcriptional regulator with XRE-family HTH domain
MSEHTIPAPARTALDPGDVGRRVALRRAELGMSREETAARAGMAVSYLAYLESAPAEIDHGALTRLAAALDTTCGALLGGGQAGPPGQGRAAAHPVLRELPKSECWRRLGRGGLARVGCTSLGGPLVLPVNYRVLDGTLVFRTAWGGPLAASVGARIAVEVDRIDEATRTGWSVLAVGTAIPVDDLPAVEHLLRAGVPDPWAGGKRQLWLRVRPDRLTGREILIEGRT